MRLIKFRQWTTGWSSGIDRMIYLGDMRDEYFNMLDDCPLMQYTGLNDINNKEIYEDDIVKFKDNSTNQTKIGKVSFSNGSFIIETNVTKHYRWIDYEVEIIGNIYENPDLIRI